MMNKGCFEKSMSDSELADILDLYYQLCSLEVTVKDRASKSSEQTKLYLLQLFYIYWAEMSSY